MNLNEMIFGSRLAYNAAGTPGGGGGAGSGAAPSAAPDGGVPASDGGTPPSVDASTQADNSPDGGQVNTADDQSAKAEGNGDGDTNTDPTPAEFKIEAPEGFEQFSAEFESFNEVASTFLTENPDATAADALKWAAEQQAASVAGQTEAAINAHNEQVQTWEAETLKHPDFGGDQAKLDQAVAKGMKAIEQLGDPSAVQLLEQTGLGSHPTIIRLAAMAGANIAEADVVGTNAKSQGSNFAQSLYGNS